MCVCVCVCVCVYVYDMHIFKTFLHYIKQVNENTWTVAIKNKGTVLSLHLLLELR